MAELPHIDEHAAWIDAEPDLVWRALGKVVAANSPPRARPFGRLLGVRPLERSGDPLSVGSTILGFRTARVQPEAELALEGEHRFSRYALIFRIHPASGGGSSLRAETRAEFPKARGRVYKALVIGTRGHVVVVRRLLRSVKVRAERSQAGARPVDGSGIHA